MQDYRQLFEEQSTTWALATRNYAALAEVKTKVFQFEGCRVKLQFNPGRITSTSANTSKTAIQARPCFLCAKNRPTEQKSLMFGKEKSSDTEYQILVNPFPVFPMHYTIAASDHQIQTICGNVKEFLALARTMNDCVIFYNGPRCGASAPDHLHFQAGNKGMMPVQADYGKWNKTLLQEAKDIRIFRMENLLRNGWVLESQEASALIRTFEQLLDVLKSGNPDSNEEPMLNALCWFENEKWICLLFPRKAHRPQCYFREDDGKMLISPASVEMGGLIIAARPEDFERIGASDIREIYSEVSISKDEIEKLSEKLFKIL